VSSNNFNEPAIAADHHILVADTDFLRAQSDPYRRMSANLYETKDEGEYYHIHGSLEATQTLKMIGLAAFRPDLKTQHEIISTIEPAVKKFTIHELETMNSERKQAGVPAFKHEDFVKTPHVSYSLDRALTIQSGRINNPIQFYREPRFFRNPAGQSFNLRTALHQSHCLAPDQTVLGSSRVSKFLNYAVLSLGQLFLES